MEHGSDGARDEAVVEAVRSSVNLGAVTDQAVAEGKARRNEDDALKFVGNVIHLRLGAGVACRQRHAKFASGRAKDVTCKPCHVVLARLRRK